MNNTLISINKLNVSKKIVTNIELGLHKGGLIASAYFVKLIIEILSGWLTKGYKNKQNFRSKRLS